MDRKDSMSEQGAKENNIDKNRSYEEEMVYGRFDEDALYKEVNDNDFKKSLNRLISHFKTKH